VLTLLLALATTATAQAETVLVLKDGKVSARNQRFAGPADFPPAGGQARRARAAQKKPPRGRPTREALEALLAQGQIDQATHDARRASLADALAAYRRLTSARKLQLGAVIDNTDAMAAAGHLVPARLVPVFLTLDANTEWWTTGPLLSTGQRVAIEGSPLVWQYYQGQGIQLQMLANFGKANAFWSGKKPKSLRTMVDALLAVGVDRGGFLAWEYYFRFGGGSPPWTSSISQGTAVQALARAGQLLQDPSLTSAAGAALGAFEVPPPTGVRVETPAGPFYAIYSYAPALRVLNAHAQALVGLYDLGQLGGDGRAVSLFHQGDATLQAVLPTYDTGLWSLYDDKREADLNYHNLNTTFLQNLCTRTGTPGYCDTAARFKGYLKTVPTVTPVTRRIRTGAPAKLELTLDKIARVGLVVARDGVDVFATSAVVGRGTRSFTWSRPAAAGVYELRVGATDLAGNKSASSATTLRILPARNKQSRKNR
jgi:hypothetical protein